ncbi:maltose acetyltransferase, partial [Terribacillus saccharophilus]
MDKSIKDGLHNSSMYLPGDKEFAERQTLCLERLYDFNQTRPSELEKREALLKEMFAEIGEG